MRFVLKFYRVLFKYPEILLLYTFDTKATNKPIHFIECTASVGIIVFFAT